MIPTSLAEFTNHSYVAQVFQIPVRININASLLSVLNSVNIEPFFASYSWWKILSIWSTTCLIPVVSLKEINSQISFERRNTRTSYPNLSNRMFDLLLHQIFVEFLSCSQAANFWYFWPPLNFALVYSLMRRMSNIIHLVLSCFQPACPYSCSSGMSQHILWFNR